MSKSTWTSGDEVKIGYMRLVVDRRIPTPGDGKPDKWLVHSLDGTRDYEFQPYSGLRLVADRRPAKLAPAKIDRRPGGQPSIGKPQGAKTNRVQRVRADQGIGRDNAAVEMMARLSRLEALLDRLGPALEGEARGRAKTKGRR